MNSHSLAELNQHAAWIGSKSHLVQCSGGNVSQKVEGTLWVKASGKKLRAAQEEKIFIPLDWERLQNSREFLLDDYTNYILKDFQNENNLQPSIETNFHAIFPNPIVSHIHSLGSIMSGLIFDSKFDTEIRSRFTITFLDYATPGIDLGKSILDAYASETKIYVLRNHGAIFLGNDFHEIENMILDFEKCVLELVAQLPRVDDVSTVQGTFEEGFITPDEAVFLYDKLTPQESQPNIRKLLLESLESDWKNDKREIFDFYLKLFVYISGKITISYLPHEEVIKLTEWKKEKVRMSMAN